MYQKAQCCWWILISNQKNEVLRCFLPTVSWAVTVFFCLLSFRVLFLLEVKAQGKNVFTNGLVLPDLCLFSISYGSSFSGFVVLKKKIMIENFFFFLDISSMILEDAVLICQPGPSSWFSGLNYVLVLLDLDRTSLCLK